MREEAVNHQAKLQSLEEDLSQARKACDAWRCKAMVAEQQRDEVRDIMSLYLHLFMCYANGSFMRVYLKAVSRVAVLQNEIRLLRETVSGHRTVDNEELRNAQL